MQKIMFRRMVLFAFAGLVATVGNEAITADRTVIRLDEKRCDAVDAQTESILPNEFHKYRKFTKVCGVGPSPKRPVLYLVAIWVDDYYSAQPGVPQAEDIPLPVLITKQGSMVGSLPLSFPGEGPLSVVVRFLDWQKDWPHQIRLTTSTAAVGDPPKVRPLYWHRGEKRFIAQGEKDNGFSRR